MRRIYPLLDLGFAYTDLARHRFACRAVGGIIEPSHVKL